jgi:AcrR family transcriptional regulator
LFGREVNRSRLLSIQWDWIGSLIVKMHSHVRLLEPESKLLAIEFQMFPRHRVPDEEKYQCAYDWQSVEKTEGHITVSFSSVTIVYNTTTYEVDSVLLTDYYLAVNRDAEKNNREGQLSAEMKMKSKLSRLKTRDRSKWIKREPVTDLGHRIVSATVEEFATKGIAGARVAEITKRAGTTDPAFYRYFAGMKEAALFIMSEYYWAPLNARLRHYRQITEDSTKLFAAVVDSLIESTENDPSRPWLSESQVFRIVVVQMRNPFLLPDAMLGTEYVAFIRELKTIIEDGQRKEHFSSNLDAELLAQLLVITLHGLLMLNSLPDQDVRVRSKEAREVASALVGLRG